MGNEQQVKPIDRVRMHACCKSAAAGLALLLAYASAAAAGRAENCPLVYDTLDLAVAMNDAEEKAYRRSLALAQERSGGDEIKRLMIVREAMLEIAEQPPTDAAPAAPTATFGTRERAGRPPAAVRTPVASPAPPRTADEFYSAITKRVDRSMAPRPSGPANSGRLAAPAASAPAIDLQKIEFADVAEKLGAIAMRPKMHQGHADFSKVFRSTVAITIPAFDTTPVDQQGDLGKLGICSGTRIGKTAVLTAAHCVCMLGLNRAGNVGALARKIRVGNRIRVNSGGESTNFTHYFEASVVPAKTRCFDGGSCDGLCSGKMSDARLAGKDVAVVFGDAFVPTTPTSGPWSEWDEVSEIADSAKFNGIVGGARGPGKGRLFAVGFGYDPSIDTNYGVGVKRCGQLVVERPCGRLGLPCRDDAELLLKADTAGDVHQDTDACPGDSGAPAFIMDTGAGGKPKFLVAGIVSRGPRLPGEFWSQCSARGSLYEFASNPNIGRWIKDTVAAGD